ncbi:hypothetical protein Hanom_Chr16g01478921 [Helianthus anomalus]
MERETMCDASNGGGGETGSGRVECSCYTGGHTMDGGGDYCYAFLRASTSTSWRCTTITTIALAAYCILVLLFYI